MKAVAMQTMLAEQATAYAEVNGGVRYPMLMQTPVRMKVAIALPGISLRGLMALKEGDVMVSECGASEELPLFASNVALSWGEFEVVDGRIAIRLTRLG